MQIQKTYANNIPQTQKAPSFTSYKTIFSKKLDEVLLSGKQPEYKDEKFLVEKLQEFIKLKMRPEKKIGSGFHGAVYKIDDRYVIKVSKHDKPYADMLNELEKPKFSQLKTYYGEPVAKFYDVEILKNVSTKGKHIPAGIPDHYFKTMTEQECREYYEKKYLPLFSSLPQKSFDAIAKDCNTLNKMGNDEISYSFDYLNPNNFVLVGKTLRITDVINKEYYPKPNTIAQLLYSFVQKTDLDGFAKYSEEGKLPRRELTKKIIIAGIKNDLPIDESAYGQKIWEVTLNDLCKIKEPANKIIKNLKHIQNENITQKEKIEKTENYLKETIRTNDDSK